MGNETENGSPGTVEVKARSDKQVGELRWNKTFAAAHWRMNKDK